MLRTLSPSPIAWATSFLAFGALLFSSSPADAQESSQWSSVNESFEIGYATEFDGVQIFPIRTVETSPAKSDVLSLKEALNTGNISVLEQGDGNVSQLTVVNTGDKPVLLAVGDVVEGGRQDRVIVSDAIIPPTKTPTTVAVNCVEQGRWTEGAQRVAFRYGGRGESALKKVLQVDANQQATWGAVAQLNGTKGSRIQQLASLEAPPVLGPVGSIGGLQQHHGILAQLQPSTGSYMASLNSAAVETHLESYTEAMEPVLSERGLVGIVIALDGELVAAEAYGDTRLFRASSKDIIRSVGLDALSRTSSSTTESEASLEDAAQFLREALSASPSSALSSPLGTDVRKISDSASAFEFHDSFGNLLHLNVYAH